MTIYHSLQDFFKKFNLDTCRPNQRNYQLKVNHPQIYQQIAHHSAFLGNASFNEKVYCFVHALRTRPTCQREDCCKPVSFNKRDTQGSYHRYCSQRCSMLDMKALIGVENSSQLASVKEKKKQSALKKYGVTNVSKAQSVRSTISSLALLRWQKKFDELEKLCSTTPAISKKEYYRYVGRLTEYTYRLNIDLLDPQRLRGKGYHLDHKVSRSFGYYNQISPVDIAKLENLELLPDRMNMSKGWKNSIEPQTIVSNESIKDFVFQRTKPVFYQKLIAESQLRLCEYCNREPATHVVGRQRKRCCKPHPNSCPEQRKKNSLGQKKGQE